MRAGDQSNHAATGIDIHPGASIGESFFIDHGTGVVIGQTAVIGNRVRLYQAVTLGARSFAKDEQGKLVKGIKRHPNVEDNVTIYPNATILGGDTTIGARTIVREYASIHRATGSGNTTVVGSDCLLLAYTHIAHDCTIGNDVTMSNLAQVAGQVVVEDHAGIGGMVGVHQDVRIGAHAFVGGMARIARDVRAIVPLADWELLGDPDAFPNARDLTRRTVSLPLYPALSDAEQRCVLEALQRAA